MRELDQGELPGYLLKYPEVFFFAFFFYVALTFPESKRYIYLDISSAATLDRAASAAISSAYPTIHL